YSFLDNYLGQDIKDSGFIPLSSSPEYHDNSIKAWFRETTNYDKALILSLRPAYTAIREMMDGKRVLLFDTNDYIDRLKTFNVNETGLTVAPGENLESSHRHHSPYMAIYPLCLLDSDNDKDKKIIENSLKQIESKGTGQWCGYSFTCMACIYARPIQADKPAKQLDIFASNFYSPNSFHLNGDQKG